MFLSQFVPNNDPGSCYGSKLAGRLDVSRKTLNENIEDMKTLTEELRKKYGLHKLELSMYVKRGYHFSIHKKFLPVKDLPNEFNQIDEGKKVHRFSSDELNQLNSRYHDSLEEIWRLTEIELGMLLNKIFDQKILTAVYRLCDSTAILDCLNSFVTYSSLCQTNTERPKLTQCGPIALHGAYHPTLLDVKAQGTVPNDVFLDETCGLHIISGRNQSGKSTFIRTVGLICVMAHTGCTVPAKFACVRMLGRIATRFNTGDDISQSQSHFSKEMNDIASIFDSIRENGKAHKSLKTTSRNEKCCSTKVSSTLVLVDELGRATSTLDGFAIACAVIEALAACPNVLTLFTTHFLGLAFAATVNPTIKDFHMSTSSKPADRSQTADGGNTDLGRTRFNYTIVNGILSERNYGIETARMAGFPQHIAVEALKLREILPVRRITVASDFAERHLKLEKSEKDNFRKSSSIVSIAQRINLIQASTTDPMELRRLLQQLQTRVKAAHHRSSSRGMRAPRSDGSLTEKEVVTSTPVLNASESNVETPETK